MIRWLIGAIGLAALATQRARRPSRLEIGIGYLGHAGVHQTLSLVEQPAANDGVAGALLAIEDNNTTGKFLNQHFTLMDVRLKERRRRRRGGERRLPTKTGFIMADLPADALLKAADALRGRGTRSCSMPARSTTACASRIAAPMWSMSRRPARCSPMALAPISGLEAVEALAAGGRLARQ